ncbi:MAG: DUF1302 family protein, partial [Burkholderiales bacterium]
AAGARYFAEFPANIKLYGLSASTLLPGGVALQGEYSFRPNQPLQVGNIDLLLSALRLQSILTGPTGTPAPGTELSGFRSVNMHQIQATATKAFGPTFKASQFVVVGEAGYTYLKLPDGINFNGPGTSLPSVGSFNAAGGSFQRDGFVTRDSWGYRLVARLDYNNAIGAATLSPRLAFAHDVRGVSPTFNQGTKTFTAGLNYNLRESFQVDLSYTNFFGGRTFSGTDVAGVPAGQSASFATGANPVKDRDFASINFSYSF